MSAKLKSEVSKMGTMTTRSKSKVKLNEIIHDYHFEQDNSLDQDEDKWYRLRGNDVDVDDQVYQDQEDESYLKKRADEAASEWISRLAQNSLNGDNNRTPSTSDRLRTEEQRKAHRREKMRQNRLRKTTEELEAIRQRNRDRQRRRRLNLALEKERAAAGKEPSHLIEKKIAPPPVPLATQLQFHVAERKIAPQPQSVAPQERPELTQRQKEEQRKAAQRERCQKNRSKLSAERKEALSRARKLKYLADQQRYLENRKKLLNDPDSDAYDPSQLTESETESLRARLTGHKSRRLILNETPEERQRRLERNFRDRERRRAETPEQKQKRLNRIKLWWERRKNNPEMSVKREPRKRQKNNTPEIRVKREQVVEQEFTEEQVQLKTLNFNRTVEQVKMARLICPLLLQMTKVSDPSDLLGLMAEEQNHNVIEWWVHAQIFGEHPSQVPEWKKICGNILAAMDLQDTSDTDPDMLEQSVHELQDLMTGSEGEKVLEYFHTTQGRVKPVSRFWKAENMELGLNYPSSKNQGQTEGSGAANNSDRDSSQPWRFEADSRIEPATGYELIRLIDVYTNPEGQNSASASDKGDDYVFPVYTWQSNPGTAETPTTKVRSNAWPSGRPLPTTKSPVRLHRDPDSSFNPHVQPNANIVKRIAKTIEDPVTKSRPTRRPPEDHYATSEALVTENFVLVKPEPGIQCSFITEEMEDVEVIPELELEETEAMATLCYTTDSSNGLSGVGS